jgi:hypothetical protein
MSRISQREISRKKTEKSRKYLQPDVYTGKEGQEQSQGVDYEQTADSESFSHAMADLSIGHQLPPRTAAGNILCEF